MNVKIELIREDLEAGITRIFMNRPPVNSCTSGFLDQMANLLDQLAADASIKAVILASSGKVFSAGMDLKEALAFDLADEQAIVRSFNITTTKLFAFPKPLIVAAGGAALAGGFFLVLTGDYRVASRKARFGLAEVRVGADFPLATMEIARATLSPNDLRRLMLSGNPISAEAALAAGIIDYIEDTDKVMDRAISVASDYAAIPPKTYATVKRQIRGAVIDQIEQAMANGANTPADGWFTAETKPAMVRMLG